MMTIPEVRAELHVLAKKWKRPRLAYLANQTKRRFFGRKAPVKALPLSPQTCAAIRLYKKANPKALQRDIATRFHTDGGRVNEVLHGYRDGRTYEQKHFGVK